MSTVTGIHTMNLGLGVICLIKKTDSSEVLMISLGDSFTEGLGAPDDSTWVALLQDNLNSQSKFKHYKCINAGQIGRDPAVSYVLLKRLLKDYTPQHVFLCINYSDMYDIVLQGGFERFENEYYIRAKSAPWFDFLYGFSHVSRLVIHNLLHYNYFLMTDVEYEKQLKKALYIVYYGIKEKFTTLAKQHGFKLWVILHPTHEELINQDFKLLHLNKLLIQDSMFYTINLFDAYNTLLHGRDAYKHIYWEQDGHHNSEGYKMWANCIADKLKSHQNGN